MTAFLRTVHLKVYQGLPLEKKLRYEEPDPVSEFHTRPLTITGRTLVARIKAAPKSKAYEIVILKDPPAPGVYEFLLTYMGVEYPFEVELLPGEGAKELQEKIIAAIKALGFGFIFGVCAESCANNHEIVVAGWWPGVEFLLELVSQPVTDPPEDQVDVDILQDNAPLAVIAATSQVVGDQLEITLKLGGDVTAGIPAAGDGPYLWSLVAPLVADPDNDVLLLARGYLLVERA